MTEKRDKRDLQTADTVLAVSAPAVRSEQPDFAERLAPDDIDAPLPTDITSILHGSQAFFGKGVWSASRMDVALNPIAVYERAQKAKAEREAQEARELARLSEWGRQRTVICGVEMTNVEAQEARQRVIDNEDRYADWAVKHGHIRDDERDEFKQSVRRKKDLEDKRGRGTISAAEEREAVSLEQSHVGHAVDAATAKGHQDRALNSDARISRSEANAALRPTDIAVGDGMFQEDKRAPAPAQVGAPQPVVAASVKATGLGL